MTASTGLRRRYLPKQSSSPLSGTRTADEPVALDGGGTGARTAAEAAEKLGVPTLAGDNEFSGVNTFDSDVFITGQLNASSSEGQFGNLIAGYADFGGILAAASGLMVQYVAKTANYPITSDDVVVDVTANSPTITLPTAVVASGGGSLSAGTIYIIKNSGAGVVTLATTGGQTIDGAPPGIVAAGAVVRLVSTGANWISV